MKKEKVTRRPEFVLFPVLAIFVMSIAYNELFFKLSFAWVVTTALSLIVFYENFSSERWAMFARQGRWNIVPTLFIWPLVILIGGPIAFGGGIIVGILWNIRARKLVYFVAYFTYAVLVYLFGVRLREKGQRPEKGQNYVGALNHGSFLDSLILALIGTSPWSAMADAKMFWIPPFGLFLTFCGGIKVKSTFRGFGLALGESIEVSKKGIIVFMFPQGERQKGHWSRLNNFKDGVSSISEKADVPILPIFLSLPGLFARVTWKRLYLCPQPVTIVYGALIHREGKEGKQLTKHVENIMKVMLAENLPNWYVHKNILKHKKPQHV